MRPWETARRPRGAALRTLAGESRAGRACSTEIRFPACISPLRELRRDRHCGLMALRPCSSAYGGRQPLCQVAGGATPLREQRVVRRETRIPLLRGKFLQLTATRHCGLIVRALGARCAATHMRRFSSRRPLSA